MIQGDSNHFCLVQCPACTTFLFFEILWIKTIRILFDVQTLTYYNIMTSSIDLYEHEEILKVNQSSDVKAVRSGKRSNVRP